MNSQAADPPLDEILRDAVHARLSRDGSRARVKALHRQPSDYATSHPLETVSVALDDGTTLELVLKQLGRRAMQPRAQRAKPAFLVDERREIAVYRLILSPRGLGAAVYGSGTTRGGAWLLVERVPGVELYQLGDVGAWVAAARWAAALHGQFSPSEAKHLARDAHLVRYDRDFYRSWLDRALRFFAVDDPPSRRRRTALDWIATRFDVVIERLLSLPETIIHGEYYASNVLAAHAANGWRACPIDWEMAAVGPGLLDLAALTFGDWSDNDRNAMIAGYAAGSPTEADALRDAIDYAHIYLAVQWLGWFGRRRPPAEHARDWLAEAVDRAERLGL